MEFALLAVFLWATQATAFKLTLRFTNPYGLVLIASTVSLICLAIIHFFSQKKLTLDLKSNLFSALTGFLNPFLYYLVLFSAYDLLLAQEALILNYLWPIVLSIISAIFLRKPFNIYKLIALILSFLGAFWVITQGNLEILKFKNGTGIALALASTIIWATYWTLNMKDKRSAVSKLFYNFLFGNIYLWTFQLAAKKATINSKWAFVGGTYVGLFEMGITFVLWLKALEKVRDTSRVSNLIYLAPFLSLLLINFVLKEKVGMQSFLGLTLIVLGILIQEGLSKREGKG